MLFLRLSILNNIFSLTYLSFFNAFDPFWFLRSDYHHLLEIAAFADSIVTSATLLTVSFRSVLIEFGSSQYYLTIVCIWCYRLCHTTINGALKLF